MKFTVPNPSLEIEFNDELVTDNKAAFMEIKKDGETLVSVQAVIERREGGCGCWHNVVVFKRIK